MNLIVSEDGYAVTGNKPLKRFAMGVAFLDEEETKPFIMISSNERVSNLLYNKEKTKPRISLFRGWIYLIIEGIEEDFHYYFPLNKIDPNDFRKIDNIIHNNKLIIFGIINDSENLEEIIECNIII